ncbi:uncharacterized protein LOC119829077 isoform X1 [Zerene cesonia]|uniref:uncharacterized protein LOC119829077 isoform X1 n=1 Tax=Zerene cesonia TaxID=33412 RepID=UPI0018E58398|nr:uncharacterized protein LOC119829077 isoform X1 [Zerene cesonia]
MKKTSSLVWRFFDRLEENKRCVAVVCKLCDCQYKYFGNTTNLRTHLVNKHPIQWELGQNGTLEDNFRVADDEDTNQSRSTPRRKRYTKSYKNDNVRYSISVNKNPDSRGEESGIPVIKVDVLENDTDIEQHDDDTEATINLVKQMENRGSDEEWLNDEVFETVEAYQPPKKKMKYRTIKREVTSPPRSTNYQRAPKVSKQIIIDNRKDEYSVFGEYVSNKLRKLKNNQTKSNIQQLITTILWQAEYGVYDSMETIKRVILHSVQDMDVQTEQVIVHQLNEGGEVNDPMLDQ